MVQFHVQWRMTYLFSKELIQSRVQGDIAQIFEALEGHGDVGLGFKVLQQNQRRIHLSKKVA
jgi:hypothetical protein